MFRSIPGEVFINRLFLSQQQLLLLPVSGITNLRQLAVVHNITPREMKQYYQYLREYWYFLLSELQEAYHTDSLLSQAGRTSLRAYIHLLHAIENTGFLELDKRDSDTLL